MIHKSFKTQKTHQNIYLTECGKRNELIYGQPQDQQKQDIKCKDCAGRIFYKVRQKQPLQYEARWAAQGGNCIFLDMAENFSRFNIWELFYKILNNWIRLWKKNNDVQKKPIFFHLLFIWFQINFIY